MIIKRSERKHQLCGKLILSLTSYPPRFDKLHLTIKTMLNQSIRPDNIILWIARDDMERLPATVTKLAQQYDDFLIRPCDDLRSYKKLVPTLVEYPDAYIVIGDDDVYYPSDWLKKLLDTYEESRTVVANRAHRVKHSNSTILPYKQWDLNCKSGRGCTLMATGVGGVLYPPNCFASDVLNEQLFMSLCSTADDVWFFWMSRTNGYDTVTTAENMNIVNWIGSHETGLAQTNVTKHGNDICIQNRIQHFGFDSIYATFKRDERSTSESDAYD